MNKSFLPVLTLLTLTLAAQAQVPNQAQETNKASIHYIFFNGDTRFDYDNLARYGLETTLSPIASGLTAGAQDLLEKSRQKMKDPKMKEGLKQAMSHAEFYLEHDDSVLSSTVLVSADRPAYSSYRGYTLPGVMNLADSRTTRFSPSQDFETNNNFRCTIYIPQDLGYAKKVLNNLGYAFSNDIALNFVGQFTAQDCVKVAMNEYLRYVPEDFKSNYPKLEILFAKRKTKETGFAVWGDTATFDVQSFYIQPKESISKASLKDYFNK